MRSLKMGVVFAFLVAASVAINIQKLMWYKLPVKRIQGQIVDPSGAPVGLVGITVFSHPEVWSDDSLSVQQKRAKQRKVAATRTDSPGFTWACCGNDVRSAASLVMRTDSSHHGFARLGRLENPLRSGGILRVRFSRLSRARPVTARCRRHWRELKPGLIPSG